MGFYATHVVPRLVDFAMKNPESARLRADWIPRATGVVLEIGMGSGLNLPFYSTEVQKVYGVEPSRELQRLASRRRPGRVAVAFLLQPAEERLPLPDASIDTVVTTWALCSVTSAVQALQQAKRVLKPEGNLIFVEHGRAPDASVARWQDRITPVWKRVTGGCHLNRKMDDLITAAGFEIVQLDTGYIRGPRPMTYTYQGCARRARG